MLTKIINNIFYKSLENSSPKKLIIKKLKFGRNFISYKIKKYLLIKKKFI